MLAVVRSFTLVVLEFASRDTTHAPHARARPRRESVQAVTELTVYADTDRVRDFTVKPESGFVFTQCVKFTVKAKCVKCPTLTASPWGERATP